MHLNNKGRIFFWVLLTPAVLQLITAIVYSEIPEGSARRSVVVDIAHDVSPAVVTIGLKVRHSYRSPFSPFSLLPDRLLSPFGEDWHWSLGRINRQSREVPYVGSGFIISKSQILNKTEHRFGSAGEDYYVITNFHVVHGSV